MPAADRAARPIEPQPGRVERVRTRRLFVALWPTPQVRAGLLAWRDAFAWPPAAAVVPPERLHLTLHFIGAVPADRIDAVQAGLAVEPAAFELAFGRAELWPRGIAVLRPLREPPALHDLQRRLGAALRALDLPVEARPFRPHVTLARRADGAAPTHVPAPLRWRVRSYALVESRLGRDGGYAVLRRYGKAAAAADSSAPPAPCRQ